MAQIIDGIKYSDDLKTVKGVEDTSITSVVIKEGVTAIGQDAFYYCSNLENIVIPEGVTSIGWRAFYGCSGLQTVTIPNSVTEIESPAFDGCYGLKEVIYLGTGKEFNQIQFGKKGNDKQFLKRFIKEFAVKAAKETKIKEIQTVSIEAYLNSMKETYPSLQFKTLNVTKTSQVWLIIGGKNATVIQSGTKDYSWSENLQGFLSVFCDETKSNDEINQAFETYGIKIAEIKKTYTKPQITVEEMNLFIDALPKMNIELEWMDSPNSFFCNAQIKKLTFARNTVIDWCTFSNGKSFESIVLPESISSIGKKAFFGCSNLQNVVIPNSVTEIGEHAFTGCRKLTVTYGGTKEEWEKVQGDKPETVIFSK